MDGSERITDEGSFDASLDKAAKRGFHTDEVTQSDLTKMALSQLEGRLNFYEREALFERNARIRKECRAEVIRTRIEINRRKMYARAEADRVFEL